MKKPHTFTKQVVAIILFLSANISTHALSCGNNGSFLDSISGNRVWMEANINGSHTYYIWKFGDGSPDSVTTIDYIQHIYPNTGSFNRCVIAVYVPGNCSDTICSTVHMGCTTNASFTYQQLYGGGGVSFTNTSTTSSNGYFSSWSFRNTTGQIGSSTARNPFFTFSGNFPYSAQLIIRDSITNCRDTVIVQLNLWCPLVASFTYQNLGGNTVQFTNTTNSTNGYTSTWYFRDGIGQTTIVSGINPQFTFTGNPPYRASLQVVDSLNPNCIDSAQVTVSLSGCNTNASFTYQHTGSNNVQFTNTSSSSGGFSSNWIFRNSSGLIGTSTSRNPQFTFTGSSPFSATLEVHDSINGNCFDTITQTINLSFASVCGTASFNSSLNGNIIQATSTSTISDTLVTYFWQLHDANGTVILQQPNVNFVSPTLAAGNYTLCLQLYHPLIFTQCDTACQSFSVGCNTNASFNYQDLGNNTARFINTSTATNGYTSAWVFSNTSGGQIGTSNANSPVFHYYGTSPYGVQLIIRDTMNNCRDTIISAVMFGMPCNTNASFTYQDLGNGAVQFTNTSTSSNGYSVLNQGWVFSNRDSVLGVSSLRNPAFTFSGIGPYITQLVIQDSLNTCLDTVTMQLNIAPPFCSTSASLAYQDLGNGVVQFTNTSTSSSGYSSTWTFRNSSGVIGNSSQRNPSFTFTGNSPFSALLYVQDSLNSSCWDTVSVSINLLQSCVTLQPGPADGIDAFLMTNTPNIANGTHIDFSSGSWTCGGYPCETKGLIKFDLSNIPTGATITSAYLTLTANLTANSGYIGTPMWGNSNASYLKRVTAPWNESTVTWNSQPTTTTANQVLLAQSTSSTQSYPNVNITAFAQYWHQNPALNYGMLLDMITTNAYNSMIFCSSDHSDPTKRPKLVICYNYNSVCNTNAGFTYQDLGNGTVQFTNTSNSLNNYGSNWTFRNSSGVIGNSTLHSPSFTFTGNAPFYALLYVQDSVNASCRDTIGYVLNVNQNSCGLVADFTSSVNALNPNNSDTITITNTSTSNTGFGNYQVTTYNSAGNIVYLNGGLSPYNPATFTVPHDSVWNVCIQIQDSTGQCSDTICKTVWSRPCEISAAFTYAVNGSAVLFYNNTIGAHGGYTSWWTFAGGTPATSTATNPAVIFPLGTNSIVACLYVIDAQGCSDSTCVTITRNDTLCGLVFNDGNANGILDIGEQRVPNANVRIDGVNYYTDASGFYRVGVGAGSHSVLLIAPFGWAQTFPTNPLSYTIPTNGNDYICGLDFGMRDDTLILSGVVYNDVNGNGLYDIFDSPRSNQTVYILGNNGNYFVTTNAQGRYSQMVYSGTYTIAYNPPIGFSFTQPLNPNSYTVTVVNTSISGFNFGVRNNTAVITGRIYVDLNGNGTYNTGEPLAANQPVQVGGVTVYTNSSGIYTSTRPLGIYTITYTPTGNYASYSSTPGSYVVNALNAGVVYGNNDFRLQIPPGTGDVCVSLSPLSCVSSGFPAWYHIYVYNNGNTPMQGNLFMYYDPNLVYSNSNITPSAVNTANQVLSWHLTSNVGQTISLTTRFNYPLGIAIGTPVFNAIVFVPDLGFTDINPACNIDTVYQLARASWDPNAKQVSPPGVGIEGKIADGELLNYTINFQNTGTAPAVNVILIDTLEDDLDLNSFEMVDASHDYHLQVGGRVLTWNFSNIMLPDSGSDFENSMGYASFKIRPTGALPGGTQLMNTGNIYFDFNEVVVTNTTLNTIDYLISVNDLDREKGTIRLQPNPFTEFTVIQISGEDGPYELKVFDVLGSLVRSQQSENNLFTVRRDDLAAGMYLYQITKNSKIIGTGKLVAE